MLGVEDNNIENYLKIELYNLVKTDAKIFDFIESGSLDGIWYWDIENTENEWMSPRFWEVLGYDPACKKHLSSEWQDIIFQEDLKVALENFKKHCEDPNHPYDQIVRYSHKNGSTVWIRCRGIAIRDENGKPIRMLGAHTDVTKIKEKEKNIKQVQSKMEIIFNGTHDSMALIYLEDDGKLRYKYVNKALKNFFGLKDSDIVNKTPQEVFRDESGEMFSSAYKKCISLKKVLEVEEEVVKDGVKNYFQTTITPVFEENGEIYVISSKKNITSQKELEKKLREERALFKTTLHSLGDAVISSDINGNVCIMNEVAEKLTGWSMDEAKNLPFDSVFTIINEFSREIIESPIKKVFETGQIIELANNTMLIKKNGEEIPIEDSAAPIKDEMGIVSGAVIVFRDFTEKKQRQEKIEYLSYHDQLTGLYNRRYYEEEIKRLDKDEVLPVTIVMIDVNGLKLTNDAFGHQIGDKLLISVAKAISEACSGEETVARLGGDEFIILLPNADNSYAEKLVERIYSNIRKQNNIENIIISVSIGWENKILKEQKIEDVVAKADEYMYRKKLTESQKMRNDTVSLIVHTLNATNEMEKIHSETVSKFARKIGEAMKLDAETLNELEVAGSMHDIGKIAVNRDILNKPEKLNSYEFIEIKRHSETGYHILKSVNKYNNIAEYVLAHHERWDGNGYPKGLVAEESPLVARIISVADAVAAMTSYRPYRNAISIKDAINELERCSGTQFDPYIVKIAKDIFNEKLLE